MAATFFQFIKINPNINGVQVTGSQKKKWKFGVGSLKFKVKGQMIQKNGKDWLKRRGNTFTFIDPNGGKVPGIKVLNFHNKAPFTVTFDKPIKKDQNADRAARAKKRNEDFAKNRKAREAREAKKLKENAAKAQAREAAAKKRKAEKLARKKEELKKKNDKKKEKKKKKKEGFHMNEQEKVNLGGAVLTSILSVKEDILDIKLKF